MASQWSIVLQYLKLQTMLASRPFRQQLMLQGSQVWLKVSLNWKLGCHHLEVAYVRRAVEKVGGNYWYWETRPGTYRSNAQIVRHPQVSVSTDLVPCNVAKQYYSSRGDRGLCRLAWWPSTRIHSPGANERCFWGRSIRTQYDSWRTAGLTRSGFHIGKPSTRISSDCKPPPPPPPLPPFPHTLTFQ